ncbi:MAG: nucleotide exchange factor GrpE [Gammaproteobacteria bacterium]
MANEKEPLDDIVDDGNIEPEINEEAPEDQQSVDESAPLSELESLQRQLEAAEKKASENWETALRAQAETDNVRKRAVKDVESAHKYSVEKLINEFLPVKDSLELGINASENAEVKSLVEGMELTLASFSTALEKCGVQMVDPAGEKFDPEHHQAMTMIESPDVESGMVIDVMQKGYLLNERLIRPAMVIVAK